MRISDWSSDVCSSDLKRYTDFVAKVRAAEQAKAPGSTDLAEAVARYFFKLMAYKDEYEVARLYTSGDFRKKLQQQFDGDYKLHFHLAPPLLAKRNAKGELVKKEYRSEEHTSELQSLMRISYAVFCLKKKNTIKI